MSSSNRPSDLNSKIILEYHVATEFLKSMETKGDFEKMAIKLGFSSKLDDRKSLIRLAQYIIGHIEMRMGLSSKTKKHRSAEAFRLLPSQ